MIRCALRQALLIMESKGYVVRGYYIYKGVTIWRNTQAGYHLRYTAKASNGQRLAADTLSGIKQLIREA